MAITVFKAWKSTVTPQTARWVIPTDKWLIDPNPQSLAIVGAQNPNFYGADARFTPVDISAAEQATPPPLLLADLDAIFRLAVYPYTWYRSDGTHLIPLGGQYNAGSNISIVYDPVSNSFTISSTGGGGGGGTVTSVGLALDTGLYTVSGSPVTTAGTLTGTLNAQTANYVFMGPASGPDAKPTFRALVDVDLPPAATAATVAFVIDGSGSVITGGVKPYLQVMFPCTIQEVTLLADQTGSITVDIWKCTYAQFDAGSTHPVVGDSITAAAVPAISSAVKYDDATLTGWTTTINAGDILAYNVSGVTALTKCTITLKVLKS